MGKSFWQESGADYASHRPSYPTELASTLAELAPNRDTALDVGCGTGQLSALLAQNFNQVIATDVSASQLAHATKADNIQYEKCPAEAIIAPDKSCALITAAQAAHWFDLPRFYTEAERVAQEGAIIALITYGVFETDKRINDTLQAFYWNDIHPFWPKGRHHVETGYTELHFPFEPATVPSINIERVWTVDQLMNYMKTWSATKRAIAAGEGQLLEHIQDRLLTSIGPDEAFAIKWPISVRAGRIS